MLKAIDPLGVRRRMTIYFGKLHELFDRMIDQRLQSRASTLTFPTSNRDILDTLLDLSKENNSEFGRNDIKTFLLVSSISHYLSLISKLLLVWL